MKTKPRMYWAITGHISEEGPCVYFTRYKTTRGRAEAAARRDTVNLYKGLYNGPRPEFYVDSSVASHTPLALGGYEHLI